MQISDDQGDPTPAGLAAGGTVVVVIAGGAAAAGDSSDWVAPVIALIGAVFVAVLTAITTNRRQAKQLSEERARQAAELAAERARLRLQLAHERDLGELVHLRKIFDQAATIFEERLRKLDDLARAIKTRAEEEGGDYDVVLAAHGRSIKAQQALMVFLRRLDFSLPVEHEATTALIDVYNAFNAWEFKLWGMSTDNCYDEVENKAGSDSVIPVWRQFADTARDELDRRAVAK
jgi:type II secretory pathway pseudopilin PulG